jgi:hypothetical protein
MPDRVNQNVARGAATREHLLAVTTALFANRRMWALHAGYLTEEVIPAVPAPVLAEAWRGGSRQANLVRFLRMCDIEPMTEDLARQVGVQAGNPVTMTLSMSPWWKAPSVAGTPS